MRKRNKEEIKSQNDEKRAAAAEEARIVEREALERAAKRRKREEAEGNTETKEEEEKEEMWLAISYKSGCTGERLVEYTSDGGKVWLEKQLLLSLNDRIAKNKKKVFLYF